MKIKILLLVLTVSSFLTACNKKKSDDLIDIENRKSFINVFNPIYGKDCIGSFTLLNQRPYNPQSAGSAPRSYFLSGNLQSPRYAAENAVNVDGGTFFINFSPVKKTTDLLYFDTIPITRGMLCFGSLTMFTLSGNASVRIDSFSTDFYVPAEIAMTGPSVLTLSQKGANTITWNADGLHSGNVFIRINYKGAQSNHMDTNLSDKDVIFEDAVRDKGSYSIPSSALAGMPVGGLVDITIGRGSYSEIKQKDGKIILVSAGSVTYGEFTLNQ